MRAAIYTRVSTREQSDSGLGLEAQKTKCLREIEAREWSLASIYVEVQSAGRQRPKLDELMRVLDAGGADVLMVSRLDRLSRSFGEFGVIVDRARTKGWAVVILDPPVDLSTPAGRMVAGVLAVFAQWERDLISQRTKEGLAARKARGAPRLPQHEPYSDERTIRRIMRRHEEGMTAWGIAKYLTEMGVPGPRAGRWNHMTVAKIIERETIPT